MEKTEIAIIAPSVLPVPAVKGGAVESLIETIVQQNEVNKRCRITVYSIYDEKAVFESLRYKETEFIFISGSVFLNRVVARAIYEVRKLFNVKFCTPYIRSVLKHISKKKFASIIIEGNSGLAFAVAAKTDIKNKYMHIHHDAFNNPNRNTLALIKSYRKIISVSEYIKRQILKIEGVREENVVVLKNCTNIDLFNKELYLNERKKMRSSFGINDDEIVILFSGRILAIKGVKELILAFKKLAQGVKAKLMIVGSAGFGNSKKSKYDDELMAISKDIKDKIIFTGFIQYKEMPLIYAMAEIAVVPSICNEAAPLAVFEAMASGLPLVVTDSGGIPEYTSEECAITIVRNKDLINNLSKALLKLAIDEELRNRMGQAGREHVKQYNSERYYTDFMDIVCGDM